MKVTTILRILYSAQKEITVFVTQNGDIIAKEKRLLFICISQHTGVTGYVFSNQEQVSYGFNGRINKN